MPGIEGAHEKGGVEGEGGRFRRNHLVPVPKVASLAELNAEVAAIDEADDQRRIGGRRITVRNCHYSVPARFIGRKVRVRLRSNELIVLGGRTRIAHHERSTCKGAQVLDLDHYLAVLKIKPGALPGATALVQARECGSFTSAHGPRRR